MVYIHIGGESTNRDNNIYNMIAQENKRAVVIVPEQKNNYYENMILEILGGVNSNVEILSFNRMPYILFKNSKKRNNIYVDEVVREIYLRRIIEENKEELKILNNVKILKSISNTITQIYQRGIKIEELEEIANSSDISEILKIKLKDIVYIYRKYSEEKLEMFDIEERNRFVLEEIEKLDYFQNSNIYVLGFTQLTEIQTKILGEIVRNNKNIKVHISIIMPKIKNGNTVFAMSEKLLANLLKEFSKQEVYVLEPDPEKDEFSEISLLKQELEKYDIYELLTLNKDEELSNVKISGRKLEKTNNVLMYSFEEKKDEIDFVAADIKKKIDAGVKPIDIQIIMNDYQNYIKEIEDVFRRNNLKIYIQEEKLKSKYLFRYIISTLKLASGEISQVVALFKEELIYETTMFKDIIREILKEDKNEDEEASKQFDDTIEKIKEEIYSFEKYVKKWKIDENSIKKEFKYAKNQTNYTTLEMIRNLVIKILEETKKEILGITGKEISSKLYKYIEKEELLNLIYVKIYIEQYKEEALEKITYEANKLNLVLEKLSNVEKVDLKEYIEYFEMVLESEKTTSKEEAETVRIITAKNSVKKDYVYILSMDEENFPGQSDISEILSKQENLEVLSNGIKIFENEEEKEGKEDLENYIALTGVNKKLILTYSKIDKEGQKLSPSIYLKGVSKILNKKIDDFKEKTQNSDPFNIIENINKIKKNKYSVYEEIEEKIIEFETCDLSNDEKEYKNQEQRKEKIEKYINSLINNMNAQNLTLVKEEDNKAPKLSKQILEKIYNDRLNATISRIEKYASCPFAYHMRHILQIKRPEGVEIESSDLGSFLHEVIKETFDKIEKDKILEKRCSAIENVDIFTQERKIKQEIAENANSIQNLEKLEKIEEYKEEIKKIVQEKIEEVYQKEEFQKFKATEKNTFVSQKAISNLPDVCIEISESLRLSDFRIYANEMKFGIKEEAENRKSMPSIKYELGDGKTLNLRGIIDRVDVDSEGNVRIIDYKSSDKKLDETKMVEGLSLQLLVYLETMAKLLKGTPSAMLYKKIIRTIKKEEGGISDTVKDIVSRLTGKIIVDRNDTKLEKYDKTLQEREYKTSSNIISAKVNKDGEIKEGTKGTIISKEEYEEIEEKTISKIKEMSLKILEGNIDIYPYKLIENKRTKEYGCEYCEFKKICKHSNSKNGFRFIIKNANTDGKKA